jgi:hypothetical protein
MSFFLLKKTITITLPLRFVINPILLLFFTSILCLQVFMCVFTKYIFFSKIIFYFEMHSIYTTFLHLVA